MEAYVALRLAGDDPGDPHMSAAAAWVREHGGVESTRVFTHVWLAMVGRWDWDKLPAVPPELIFLPPELAPFYLVVRLLGPPDDRGAVGHNRAQAVAPAPVRDRGAPLWASSRGAGT